MTAQKSQLLEKMLNFFLNFLSDNFILVIFLSAIGFVVFKIYRRESHHKQAKKILDKAIKSGSNEPMSLHPEIETSLCVGCGSCTNVCPEGDILRLIDHKAVLVGPSKCVGHGECERACPMGAIKLVFGTKTRGMDIPRLSKNYETNVKGLYIAGELGGMGLIRNAIKQGILAAQDAIKNISESSNKKTDYDLLIVGAGPAGLAASLAAIASKKSYLTIEQGGFGGTVYSFPRQKVVMTHPFELPMIGKKKFSNNKVSKEELLEYWESVRKSTGLKIKEQTKFETLETVDGIFKVKTNSGDYTAKKVILGLGVRGSPRKLGVPGEDTPKVTYNLIDPEQYQNMDVVVVGGGNAGVEAAQMLGDKKWNNRVHLLVRSQTFDRCNEDNINRITAMAAAQRVTILFNSSIQEIKAQSVSVKTLDSVIELKNDYVFVFAGAEMPHKFLMSLGVQIEKKFGEGLQ